MPWWGWLAVLSGMGAIFVMVLMFGSAISQQEERDRHRR